MTAVIIDSNVLIDVITDDPTWGDWSSHSLMQAADEAILVINAIIYAEVSIGFDSIESLEEALPHDLYRREHLPFEAAFLAGKAFRRYRAAGGTRRSPLPDFYIGDEHAGDDEDAGDDESSQHHGRGTSPDRLESRVMPASACHLTPQ